MNGFTRTVDSAVDALAGAAAVDAVADGLVRGIGGLPESLRSGLRGDWLGIPLHPVLTDVTIGAWTGSFVADLVGGRDARAFSQRLLLLGNLSAAPTIAAGLADWRELDRPARRVGVVHAAVNATATLLYLRSYGARRRGRYGSGVAWGLAGATVATVGGHLGGVLAYRPPTGAAPSPDARDHGTPDRTGPSAPPFAPESVRIG